MVQKVCVIGAGPSGLIALKCLIESSNDFEVTVYEQTAEIGGTWVYTDNVGTDENGLPVHTSMYKYLSSNLPKEVMEIDSFNMPKDLHSYVTHEDFLKYLQEFCAHFHLKNFIKFKTKVCNVTPIPDTTQWRVTMKSLDINITEQHTFDAVVVCNGHYSVPYVPDIPGLESFPGKWLHSRNYRVPDVFSGQTVVVVGGSMSGKDVAIQLSTCAKKVYVSHKATSLPLTSDRIQSISLITNISENIIKLKDNTEINDVDVIIFCTGYHYNFEFLDECCQPQVGNHKKITPLYQHIIHVEYPTLFFVGLPMYNPPMITAGVQSRFVVAALDRTLELPTKEEMYKHIDFIFEREAKTTTILGSVAMSILYSQWEYYDDLANLGKFEKLPRVIEKVFKEAFRKLIHQYETYKNVDYEIISEDDFVERWW